jgi:hypothetical protein
MSSDVKFRETKVPEVTLGFWIIKILATTLAETGGDTVTMAWLRADVMVNSGTWSEVRFLFQSSSCSWSVKSLPRDFIPSSIGRSLSLPPRPAHGLVP